MTDAQKIEALTSLLNEVIHHLEMKRYEIEDPTESHLCEVQADEFFDRMSKILYASIEDDV
jgi:hypothetical protein